MKQLLWLPALLLTISGLAQSKNSVVKFINPATVAVPKGYSHAAVVDLGTCRMVILSGQVALDPQGQLIGKGDMGQQTEQVFRNIQRVLEAAGGNMSHIVKLGYFIKDMAQAPAMRAARDKFLHGQEMPASTLVEVKQLFREDVLIEVEATAVVPK